MTNAPDMLQAAIAHHQAGRLDEASRLYQQVLSADPRNAEAVHLLGVLALQSGQVEAAIRLITSAIQLDSTQSAYYSNLGEACRAAGQHDAARQWFLEATRRQPPLAAPFYNLALLEAAAGDVTAAADHCRQAVALRPDYAEAHNLLGNMLRCQGRSADAHAAFARALACNPNYYDALVNLAGTSAELSQPDRAAEYLDRALRVAPRSADAYLRYGDLKSTQNDWDAAVGHYRQAIAFEPMFAVAEYRLGMALDKKGSTQEAADHLRRAVELAPDDIEARVQLGSALEKLLQEVEAEEHYRAALAADPANVAAVIKLSDLLKDRRDLAAAIALHDAALAARPDLESLKLNRGLLLLQAGDFAAGWAGYRLRLNVFTSPADVIRGVDWDGSSMPDATLLVHGEQGAGDVFQFLRFLPAARRRVRRAVLAIRDPLVCLLEESGYDDVVGFSGELPSFDVKISLLDLPHVLDTTLETLPDNVPYLGVARQRVEAWKRRLGDVPGFRVGICWQGNPEFPGDQARSIPLSAFAPLAQIPGVRLISLQKVHGLEQLDSVAGQFEVIDLLPEYDEEESPFLNAAAVIENLQLVITPDTAIAHLAGALGARVWVALPARSDWRWMLARDDSPWYPTMRLFRQAKHRDWNELFGRIAAALAALVDRKSG